MLALIVVAVWVYLAVAHGRFWQAGPELPRDASQPQMARVAVVIPARDEAEHVEHTLLALLRQTMRGLCASSWWMTTARTVRVRLAERWPRKILA